MDIIGWITWICPFLWLIVHTWRTLVWSCPVLGFVWLYRFYWVNDQCTLTESHRWKYSWVHRSWVNKLKWLFDRTLNFCNQQFYCHNIRLFQPRNLNSWVNTATDRKNLLIHQQCKAVGIRNQFWDRWAVHVSVQVL